MNANNAVDVDSFAMVIVLFHEKRVTSPSFFSRLHKKDHLTRFSNLNSFPLPVWPTLTSTNDELNVCQPKNE